MAQKYFIIYIFLIYVTLSKAASAHHENGTTKKGHANRALRFPCQKTSDCKNFNETAKCVEHFCMCEGKDCTQKEDILQAVEDNLQCKKNEDCTIDHQVCYEGVCICDKNYKQESGRCVNEAENKCSNNEECQNTDPFMVCKDGSCMCSEGYKTLPNKSCVKHEELGQNCTEDTQCNGIKFTQCYNGTCVCVTDYIPIENKCYSKAEIIESPCQYSLQCSSSFGNAATCVNGNCKCKDLHWFDSKSKMCLKDVLVGEACENHEDCHQPGEEDDAVGTRRMECIVGKCVCVPPYEEKEGLCVSGAAMLGPLLFTYVMSFLLYL